MAWFISINQQMNIIEYVKSSCNKLLSMNIKHIPIPFDELELFKQQEKYQNYLVQTLIYSTKVTIHHNNSKSKYIFILTKRHLWVQEQSKGKNKISIPINAIIAVIKSEEHPQLVLYTESNFDNLRISANNEDRCQHIVSALSFYFTYLTPNKRKLKIYLIKQNSLLYFQRTSKEKRTGPKLNLQRYPCEQIGYVESKDSPDIFGKLLIQKMQLVKLINSEGSHLAHVAKVNQNEEYICHTLDNDPDFMKIIKFHENLSFVTKLLYVRSLQYKMQLFFEPMISLRPNSMNIATIFQQIFSLYDKIMSIDSQLYLSPYMICLQSEHSSELFLRQFRYKQLRFDDNYQKFLYKKIINAQNQNEQFVNKVFNIGMILYFFLFGRSLFQHEDLQVSIYLKENIKQVPFPRNTKAVYTKATRSFIESCILARFDSQQTLLNHTWIKQNSIKI